MYRVCIAEDEEWVLKSIQKRVEEYGLEVVGIAGNGLEAMNLYVAVRPDIYIIDINMPYCSGLEFAARVKELYPDNVTQFVVITGYDDFEYMRSAIHIGVADYIMKPILQEEFAEVMGKICRKVDDIKRWKHREYVRSLESIDLYMERKQVFAGTALLLYEKNLLDLLESGDEQRSKFLQDYFPLSKWEYIRFHESRNILILHGEHDENNWKLFNQLWVTLVPGTQLQVICTSCRSRKGRVIIRELIDSLNERFWIGNRRRLCFAHPTILSVSQINLSEIDKAVETTWKDTWKTDIKELFQLFFEDRQNAGMLQMFYHSLMLMIAGKYQKYACEIPDKVQNSLYMGAEEVYEDYSSMLLAVEGVLGSLREVIEKRAYQNEIPSMVAEYIEQHWQEELTLNHLAEVFYQSPGYLGTKFKENMLVSPMKYLENYRLQRAEDYLRNSRMSISDISSAVGYNDPNYFARIFKKKYGITPREYRKRI